ncbi:MAG: hypothetical protein WCC10_13705 [Tumebacillaceae bacterium]
MSRFFLVVFVASIIVSYLIDLPKLRKSKNVEKWIYGILMGSSCLLAGLSLFQIRVELPTSWIANEIIPKIQLFMMH